MKIKFLKDIGVDVFLHTGDAEDRSFRKWQELPIKELIDIDSNHYDIVLLNDDVLCGVKKNAVEVVG